MDFPINFSSSQSEHEQAAAILDTVAKAIQDPNYKEHLSPYAISARQQFSEPPSRLINHLKNIEQNAVAGGYNNSAIAISHIVQFLEQ
ncbi:MAG: hypothetical protein ACFE0J_03840 [Elainellaceae cyanobacterium]